MVRCQPAPRRSRQHTPVHTTPQSRLAVHWAGWSHGSLAWAVPLQASAQASCAAAGCGFRGCTAHAVLPQHTHPGRGSVSGTAPTLDKRLEYWAGVTAKARREPSRPLRAAARLAAAMLRLPCRRRRADACLPWSCQEQRLLVSMHSEIGVCAAGRQSHSPVQSTRPAQAGGVQTFPRRWLARPAPTQCLAGVGAWLACSRWSQSPMEQCWGSPVPRHPLAWRRQHLLAPVQRVAERAAPNPPLWPGSASGCAHPCCGMLLGAPAQPYSQRAQPLTGSSVPRSRLALQSRPAHTAVRCTRSRSRDG